MLLKFHLSLLLDDANSNILTNFDKQRDAVFVCGSCKSLGEWNIKSAVELKQRDLDEYQLTLSTSSLSSLSSNTSTTSSSSSTSSLYSCSSSSVAPNERETTSANSSPNSLASNNANTSSSNTSNSRVIEFERTIELNDPSDRSSEEIAYKYFIAQKSKHVPDRLFLKHVEYNWRKFNISSNPGVLELNDKYPLFENEEKPARIDNGWLISDESEIQFHFYNNPLQTWIPNLINKPVSIEIVPLKTSGALTALDDYFLTHMDFDEENIINDKKTQFNALNNPKVYSSFKFRSFENPADLLFQINLNEFDSGEKLNPTSIATTYFKVNKSLLQNSLIDVELSLINSNQIIGSLQVEILLINGVKEINNCIVDKNYNYHFSRSCIPIGHRGMGKTFDGGSLPNIHFVENTIDSFREAFNRGAQMVEFDVVLTKDKIPIIYHDFTFCIDHPTDKDSNKFIDISVNQLTYDEVKQNKVYSHKILKTAKTTDVSSKNDREGYTSKLMFPTLREMCRDLDTKLGFNVEIKYPLDLEDGSHEVDNYIKWLNRNEYVDIIIKELYESCRDNQRCVIISTFDPNLCSMIRMKQNKFPVLFLTNGKTEKWTPYRDVRCKNTQISLNYAKAEYLHGLVAHAEELAQNLHLIKIIFSHTSRSANFFGYTWGDDLNEAEKRKLFTENGMNGIIYDRINEINH